MAKKFKIAKLMNNKNDAASNAKTVKSAFNNHSERIQKAKQKKIEKLKDTKNRLMSKKKENKAIKITSRLGKGNKASKFALLDEPDEKYQPTNQLTHRGTSLDKVKHFNDMHFDNQESGNLSEHFDDMHDQVNFHGFDQENQGRGNDEAGDRRKSKNEIYKQIIEKSKKHKRDRQEQYEQNFNAAVELDEEFPELVSKLKFRNNDAKVREKMENRDLEYERLMNQLKEDERVVANRVVDNNKKGVQKIRKRKNEQLNQLMRNSDDQEEEDIRGWVKGFQSGSDQQESEEQNEDQIDQVALSSGDEDDEQGQDDEEEEENQNEDDEEGESEEQQEESEQIKVDQKRKIIIKNESSDESQAEDNEVEQPNKANAKNKQIVKSKQLQSKPNPKNNRKMPFKK